MVSDELCNMSNDVNRNKDTEIVMCSGLAVHPVVQVIPSDNMRDVLSEIDDMKDPHLHSTWTNNNAQDDDERSLSTCQKQMKGDIENGTCSTFVEKGESDFPTENVEKSLNLEESDHEECSTLFSDELNFAASDANLLAHNPPIEGQHQSDAGAESELGECTSSVEEPHEEEKRIAAEPIYEIKQQQHTDKHHSTRDESRQTESFNDSSYKMMHICHYVAYSILACCPLFPDFRKLSTRSASFHGWPHPNRNLTNIAKAGFYYTGNGDWVKCFCCRGSLHNWRPGDDPWIRHVLGYPGCSFMLLCKGPQFIRYVKPKNSSQLLTISVPADDTRSHEEMVTSCVCFRHKTPCLACRDVTRESDALNGIQHETNRGKVQIL